MLVSNLNANLGALYRTAKKIDLAQAHMKMAMVILEKYELLGYHDSIVQYINYAALLADAGDATASLAGLRRIEPYVLAEGDATNDHAELLETMGCISLMSGDIPQGTTYLKRALAIYEEIWSDDLQLIEEKKETGDTGLLCGHRHRARQGSARKARKRRQHRKSIACISQFSLKPRSMPFSRSVGTILTA